MSRKLLHNNNFQTKEGCLLYICQGIGVCCCACISVRLAQKKPIIRLRDSMNGLCLHGNTLTANTRYALLWASISRVLTFDRADIIKFAINKLGDSQ